MDHSDIQTPRSRPEVLLPVSSDEVKSIMKKILLRADLKHSSRTARLREENSFLNKALVQLRNSLPQIVASFHFGPSAIAICDLFDGKFIYANECFLNFTNLQYSQVIGQTVKALKLLDDLNKLKKLWRLLLKNAHVEALELAYLAKNGGLRYGQVSLELMEVDGKKCVLLLGHDITNERRLEQEVLSVAGETQARIGRDLHDGLSQELAAAVLMTNLLLENLGSPNVNIDRARADAVDIASVLKKSITETRHLASRLSPIVLPEGGLQQAIHELAANVTARCNVSCLFNCDNILAEISDKVAIHAYRIVDEAIHNAIKNAQTTRIVIQFQSTPVTHYLEITDDGIEMPGGPAEDGPGMSTMHYRANLIDGTLDCVSRNPKGRIVRLSFPRSTHAHNREFS